MTLLADLRDFAKRRRRRWGQGRPLADHQWRSYSAQSLCNDAIALFAKFATRSRSQLAKTQDWGQPREQSSTQTCLSWWSRFRLFCWRICVSFRSPFCADFLLTCLSLSPLRNAWYRPRWLSIAIHNLSKWSLIANHTLHGGCPLPISAFTAFWQIQVISDFCDEQHQCYEFLEAAVSDATSQTITLLTACEPLLAALNGCRTQSFVKFMCIWQSMKREQKGGANQMRSLQLPIYLHGRLMWTCAI